MIENVNDKQRAVIATKAKKVRDSITSLVRSDTCSLPSNKKVFSQEEYFIINPIENFDGSAFTFWKRNLPAHVHRTARTIMV